MSQADYTREWHVANPQNKQKTRTAMQARRAQILAAKDVPCADCGIKYASYVMDFDHNGSEKLFDISRQGPHKGEATLAAELAKCEVVCANCHRVRTHEERKAW